MKSPEQQSVMVLHRTRSILIRQRIQISNAIHMAEFGMAAAVGRQGLHSLIEVVHDAADERGPVEARGCLAMLASALVGTIADPGAFKTGRNLAAWIGLVPKQNSSGGKERLGGITKQGDRYLRQMLVVGSLAVVRYAVRNGTRRPWLVQLPARRTPKVAAVALANKTARMVWAIMTSGERYREPLAA